MSSVDYVFLILFLDLDFNDIPQLASRWHIEDAVWRWYEEQLKTNE
ncbi:7391_t:CDS:2 [Ambispora gerdemannii]|uniref:7391_t:CDS:1 n=1 Tax=Ambispora gerdemannii TaxID=144530 RepID=A0A9N8V302_9GLOM|nr:7391_t:CDS:2 [Ambispora gerdemannii]